MAMKNPPHPGLSVRHDCLAPLGLTVTEGARRLKVSRKQLSDIVNGRAGISPAMAIRLDRVFGGGAATWVRLQAAYDLSRAENATAAAAAPAVRESPDGGGYTTRRRQRRDDAKQRRGGAEPAPDAVAVTPDVARLRIAMGLTQDGFATLLGISARTVQDWEQGRRAPSGAALTLLKVVAYSPDTVIEAVEEE